VPIGVEALENSVNFSKRGSISYDNYCYNKHNRDHSFDSSIEPSFESTSQSTRGGRRKLAYISTPKP